jgi:leader peptidase (prepilin peptidase)/N-methyltransferase
MARVDLAVLRLPDVLTLPAGAVMSAGLGVCALLPGHGGSWPRALLGGAALFTLYFLLHLINPAGMGFGDVKLAPALGMALGWYGWGAVLTATFAGFALGAVAGLTLLALRRADRKTAIPFGPFMLLGALGGVLLAAGQ